MTSTLNNNGRVPWRVFALVLGLLLTVLGAAAAWQAQGIADNVMALKTHEDKQADTMQMLSGRLSAMERDIAWIRQSIEKGK